MGFKPVIGYEYHLYERTNGQWVLSMIAPNEWGKNKPFHWIATARLLADHTWEILGKNDEGVEI